MTEGNEMFERAINYAKENVTLIGGDYQAVGEMLCEFAEQETKRLQEQIEKMKCCENCARDYSNAETEEEETICDNCINYCNWKLKE